MATDIVFLAGIPATGKSHFGEWAQRECGYVHADLEKPDVIPALGIRREWDTLINAHQSAALFDLLRVKYPKIILNWGFPPRCLYAVRTLKAAGARTWWFAGDVAAARREYDRCRPGATHLFDTQISSIQVAWAEIESVFRPNILDVLSAAGVRLECTTIAQHMNVHAV